MRKYLTDLTSTFTYSLKSIIINVYFNEKFINQKKIQ